MTDYETEVCPRCGYETDPNELLIPVEIPLTGEEWLLCDPCVDKLVDWIEQSQ